MKISKDIKNIINKKLDNELHLLIDDVRDLNCDVIARTYALGISCLLLLRVTHLYLDHDLGEEKTGCDILKFMFNHFVKDFKVSLPGYIQLVTSNPVGRDNMTNILKDNGYKSKNGINFYK